MKHNKRLPENILIGVTAAILAAFLIDLLGNVLISYLQYKEFNLQYGWIYAGVNLFAVLIGILILKKSFARKQRKLTVYFLSSVMVSTFAVIVFANLVLRICQTIFMKQGVQMLLTSEKGVMVGGYLAIVFILLLVFAFIVTFMLLVNRKVKYIRYISEEAKKIEVEGFGRTMEIRGEDELSELSAGINTMSLALKEKIEQEKRIEKNKNELITNVSHDLRTPLTSIIGYVSLLKQNGFQDEEVFQEYIDVVERRLQGLNSMISELFEYTKLNSSELMLEHTDIDLISVINHLMVEYDIIYKKEGLKLEIQIEPEQGKVKADINKIVRVLQNLLDNARKYAVKGTTVIIHVYKRNGELYFEISNQTDLLRPEEMERLFDRFYKGDTARSEANSSGLGLAIVKRIVELHGGQVNASMDGNMVCFQVRLPISY